VAAMVYVAPKPSELFSGMKPEPGFHFVPVPYTKEFMDYYYPSALKTEDYPSFLPPGSSIDTIAVPSVLAAYNWKPGTERGERVNRFVETLFRNFARLQKPPFHPKWKDISLEAQVPGWKRYPYSEELVQRMKEANAGTGPVAAENSPQYQRFNAFLAALQKGTASGAEKEQLYREFLDWSSRHPPK
jgi:hypothetical protein